MIAQEIKIEFTKTYATEANARKAVEKWASTYQENLIARYIIIPTNGRYGVLFIGNSAMEAGAHFHWNTVN